MAEFSRQVSSAANGDFNVGRYMEWMSSTANVVCIVFLIALCFRGRDPTSSWSGIVAPLRPKLHLLSFGLLLLAFSTSVIQSMAGLGCHFAILEGPSSPAQGNYNDVFNSTAPFLIVGLNGWREPVYDPSSDEWVKNTTSGLCYSYNQSLSTTEDLASDGSYHGAQKKFGSIISADGYWYAGMKFQGFAAYFGTLSIYVLFLHFFGWTYERAVWRLGCGFMAVTCLCQLLSLVWFNTAMCSSVSGNACRLHIGSQSSIVSAALWLVVTLVILAKYCLPEDFKMASPKSSCKSFWERFCSVFSNRKTPDLSSDHEEGHVNGTADII
jgi:hypothetical protein